MLFAHVSLAFCVRFGCVFSGRFLSGSCRSLAPAFFQMSWHLWQRLIVSFKAYFYKHNIVRPFGWDDWTSGSMTLMSPSSTPTPTPTPTAHPTPPRLAQRPMHT